MNKKILFASAIAMTMSLGFVGCSDDPVYNLTSDGDITISASLSSDVQVVSRADANELRETYGPSLTLWLTKVGKGPVRQYNGIDNIPTDAVTLPSGDYVAEAWTGDSVSASFDQKYFKAFVPFTVTEGESTPVEVVCKIANTLVSLNYDESVDEVLRPEWSMEVGHSRGTLTFDGRDDRKGYFMMPSMDKNLTLTLTATTIDNRDYTQTVTIEDVMPGTEYVITVRRTANEVELLGGTLLDIVVNPEEVNVEENITLSLAPEIVGIDFDINQPQAAAPGTLGRRSVYIAAVDELTDAHMYSSLLESVLGANGIGLVKAEQHHFDNLEAAGITIRKYYLDNDNPEKLTAIRINLEPEFTVNIPAGEYEILFEGEDGDKLSTATLRLRILEAPINLNPVEGSDLGIKNATLRATILRPQSVVARAEGDNGFLYRQDGNTDWTYVAGRIEGNQMVAEISGLWSSTPVEYKALYDGFESDPMTFTTAAGPQLVNAGFEDWCTVSNVVYPYAANGEQFWGSGNDGAKLASETLTDKNSSLKHSGNYSARLESKFAGLFGIGKFAAGNIFVGKYLKTDGTDGVLGWGRTIEKVENLRPKKLRGWVKYSPVAVTDENANCPLKKGDSDQGTIYVALLDGTTGHDPKGEYQEWPVVIRTKSADFHLFSKDDANVVGYGELLFTGATAGSGLIPFEIDIEDVHPELEYVNIMVVCSASKYGDYFAGGRGSVMYIDDFELIY